MPAGRSQARVYPGVNDKFGRGWWDYGALEDIVSPPERHGKLMASCPRPFRRTRQLDGLLGVSFAGATLRHFRQVLSCRASGELYALHCDALRLSLRSSPLDKEEALARQAGQTGARNPLLAAPRFADQADGPACLPAYFSQKAARQLRDPAKGRAWQVLGGL